MITVDPPTHMSSMYLSLGMLWAHDWRVNSTAPDKKEAHEGAWQ